MSVQPGLTFFWPRCGARKRLGPRRDQLPSHSMGAFLDEILRTCERIPVSASRRLARNESEYEVMACFARMSRPDLLSSPEMRSLNERTACTGLEVAGTGSIVTTGSARSVNSRRRQLPDRPQRVRPTASRCPLRLYESVAGVTAGRTSRTRMVIAPNQRRRTAVATAWIAQLQNTAKDPPAL